MSFRSYLCGELQRYGFDDDIYIDYLISILDGDATVQDIFPWLKELIGCDDAIILDLAQNIYHHFKSGTDNSIYNPQIAIITEERCTSSNIEDNFDLGDSFIDSVLKNVLEDDESKEKEQCTDSEYLISDEYNYREDQDDELSNDAYADYTLNQAFYVDDMLLTHYPNVQYSSAVIFEALQMTNYSIEEAFNLIIYAQSLVDQCRPCRHMLNSKCLRRDCYFDHDVSEIPCRYWLLSVGCSNWSGDNGTNSYSTCPFQHHLPQVNTYHNNDVDNRTEALTEDFPSLQSTVKVKVKSEKTTPPTGKNYAMAVNSSERSNNSSIHSFAKKWISTTNEVSNSPSTLSNKSSVGFKAYEWVSSGGLCMDTHSDTLLIPLTVSSSSRSITLTRLFRTEKRCSKLCNCQE
jgi:hypothetical protein